MNRFELARPGSVAEARELLSEKQGAVLKAGGIDLIDHLKERLVEPPRLVDLKSIPGLKGITPQPDGSLRIGTLTTLAEVAGHASVRKTHPALAEACGEAASPQIRNVATIGGNLLQRPRCWYYRLESYKCLKKGGDVCFAWVGENRYHAILGGGPSYAPHPSNAAVPLVAYGGSLVLDGPKGKRNVPASEFFTPPTEDAEKENQLAAGEVLTEILVPPAEGTKSAYAQISERGGFDWPLVGVAAVLRLEAGSVKQASIVLGAVAPIPWRAGAAQEALVGKALDEASAGAAARASILGAQPLSDNGYKVGLVQTLVRRTLLSLA